MARRDLAEEATGALGGHGDADLLLSRRADDYIGWQPPA